VLTASAVAAVAVAVVVAVVGLAAVAVGRRFLVVTVRGASMEPTHRDGERVLARRDSRAAIERGSVVVVEVPDTEALTWSGPPRRRRCGNDLLIKRVLSVPGDPVPRARIPALAGAAEPVVPAGFLVLLGDNQERSFDSKLVGYFPVERVQGIVIRRLG
jgi:signal peptidase I